MKIIQKIREYKVRKAINYLRKNIMLSFSSYGDLEQVGIEDVLTGDKKIRVLEGEIAIIIKKLT